MPIDRSKFKLDLSAIATSSQSSFQSTLENLRANKTSLQQDMQKLSPPAFRRAESMPSYTAVSTVLYSDRHSGFATSTAIAAEAFVHACRDAPLAKGEFAGDKFHLSVALEQLPQAFDGVAGLLFSPDSPIDKWKVANVAHEGLRQNPQKRISVGAQFTLYVVPDGDDSRYSAEALSRTRHFIGALEEQLDQSGIAPGTRPESDVAAPNWRYTSYRNEHRSARDGSAGDMAAQRERLKNEPFYQLMTE